MSQSRWARLERCEAQIGGRGQIMVIAWHHCQEEATVEEIVTRQLGHAWRPQDMLVMIEQSDSCPPGPHAHQDQRILIHLTSV